MLVIGLMSGTSLDGVDAVLVEITESTSGEIKISFKDSAFHPYSTELKKKLLSILPPNEGSIKELAYLHYHLAEEYAASVEKLLKKTGLFPHQIDLIGCHGQTVCNLPASKEPFSPRARLQIGDISVLAVRTGITTVGDFRPADVAAGGDGGPIVSYFDFYAFKSNTKNRVVVNIGGIANITYLPAGATLDDVQGFDTGPGNMVIDALVRHFTRGAQSYDKDGELAALGKVHAGLLEDLLKHPFVRREPPKSAGREEFGSHFVAELLEKSKDLGLSNEDIIATATAFTAEAIAWNCHQFIGAIDEVIVGGGGALNKTLRRFLQQAFKEIPVKTTEEYGVPIKAREAMGIALLAYQAFHRRPNNVPRVTGAKKHVVMGKIAWKS